MGKYDYVCAPLPSIVIYRRMNTMKILRDLCRIKTARMETFKINLDH